MTDLATQIRPRRRRSATIAALVIVIPLSVMTLLSFPGYFYNSGSSDKSDATALMPSGGEARGASFGNGGSSVVDAVAPSDNQLSYDASLRLDSDSPSETIERVSQLVRDVGGTIESLSIRTEDSETAVANFRVPAEALTTVFNDVSTMGNATDKELSARNVGPTVKAATDRVAAAQAEVDRLTALVATTEPALKASVQRQLDQARSTLTGAQNVATSNVSSVAFSTLSVSINTDAVTLTDRQGGDAFTYAVTEGWNTSAQVLGIVLTVLGFLLSLLIIPVILLLLAAAAVRIGKRTWAFTRPLFR